MHLGFDGLMNFYSYKKDKHIIDIEAEVKEQLHWNDLWAAPYIFQSDERLFDLLSVENNIGITATAPGFYGPQGRILRLALKNNDLNQKLHNFNYNHLRFINFEMETSALLGLSNLLGHQACTICAVVANRLNKTFSRDYQSTIDRLIQQVLTRLLK